MLTKEAYCATTEPVVTGHQAHSSPMAFLFYKGAQFPAEYRGDVFLTLRGSWNRTAPVGYKIVRVHFANGAPAPLPGRADVIEDFLTGFLIENGASHFGRIAGLTVDSAGALVVAEDTNGVVYRVSFPAGVVPADAGAGRD